jgi:hypothetical protein
MKSIQIIQTIFLIIVVFNSSCGKNIERCTGEFAEGVYHEQCNKATVGVKEQILRDFMICSCHEGQTTLRFYDINEIEDVMSLITELDSFFKGKGFLTDTNRVSSDYFSFVNEHGFSFEAIPEKYKQRRIGFSIQKYYLKDDQGINIFININLEKETVVNIKNMDQVEFLPANYLSMVKAFRDVQNNLNFVTKNDKKDFNSTKEIEGKQIFYVNSKTSHFEKIISNFIPNKKFFLKREDIFKIPENNITPLEFRSLHYTLCKSDYYAIYKTEKIIQPKQVGRGQVTNSSEEFLYEEGYEEGQLYVFDPKSNELVSVIKTKYNSLYDIPNDGYTDKEGYNTWVNREFMPKELKKVFGENSNVVSFETMYKKLERLSSGNSK